MAFTRPTLTELVDRIETDFISRLALVGAVLRRSTVRVLSRVIAGAAHMLHGHLDFISWQLFPDLSAAEFLVRQAALFGLVKTAPTFATAVLGVTGVNATVIPPGTTLTRSDGAEYTTDAEVTIAAGVAAPAVTAVLAGEDGTLTVGVVLNFQSPIAGIDSTAEVDSVTTDGTDEETTDALRVRLLARMQAPPHGGNDADYETWAKEVAGVTRAWVYPRALGAGTVKVIFVRDDDADLIPSAGEVTTVQTHLGTMRPTTAAVTAAAPVASAMALEIVVVPDTAATRAAVEAELEDMIYRDAEPGDAADASAGTILLSQIRGAISNADGVTDYELTDPVADVTVAAGYLTVLGTITWI